MVQMTSPRKAFRGLVRLITDNFLLITDHFIPTVSTPELESRRIHELI